VLLNINEKESVLNLIKMADDANGFTIASSNCEDFRNLVLKS